MAAMPTRWMLDRSGVEHTELPGCAKSGCKPVDPNAVGVDPDVDRSRPPTEAAAPYDPPPKHYAANGMQPWDIIDAYGLDYYAGNVLKYLLRAGKKDIAPKVDDLKKARNCLSRLIEQEEGRGG